MPAFVAQRIQRIGLNLAIFGSFAVALLLVLWLRRTLSRPIAELRVGVH